MCYNKFGVVMELVKKEWTSADNDEFEKWLISLPTENVQFTTNIINSSSRVLGIKIPELRKIAKEICKGDFYSFLDKIHINLYEFYTIKALIIAKIKDCKLLLEHIKSFVFEIDNWATCDIFCGDCKLIKTNQDFFIDEIVSFLKSDREFVCRVGIIMLMKFYLQDKYIDYVLDLVTNIKNNQYYVKMGVAWLLAEAAIKYPNRIKSVLLNSKINKEIKVKAISKICESFRIDNEYKLELRAYKNAFLH